MYFVLAIAAVCAVIVMSLLSVYLVSSLLPDVLVVILHYRRGLCRPAMDASTMVRVQCISQDRRNYGFVDVAAATASASPTGLCIVLFCL